MIDRYVSSETGLNPSLSSLDGLCEDSFPSTSVVPVCSICVKTSSRFVSLRGAVPSFRVCLPTSLYVETS